MPRREISKKRVSNFAKSGSRAKLHYLAKQFDIILQGMHLPKKVAVNLLLFILSFIVLQSPSNIHAENVVIPTPQTTVSAVASNPQDIFSPDVHMMIKEEKDTRIKAAETKNYQLYSAGSTNRHLNDSEYALIKQIACLDEEICGNKQTALGLTTEAIAALYSHPPASGIMYAYDLLHNAGLVKSAYAQGIGFSGLTPLLPLWKTTRNIAYAVLIIIMVIIGFMIIFRMKIDPKTVISVQAALPKIVLTLIIITFSYAIVGFLVDIMYISMAIVIDVMARAMGPPYSNEVTRLQAEIITADGGVLFMWVFGNITFLGGALKEGWGALVGGNALVDTIGLLWKGITAAAISKIAIISSLLIIVLLGLLFTFIRLLIMLFNSYMQVLISLVLGPLLLLVEAVPGKSAFGGWISNIVANLIVFPTTAVILMFGTYLSSLKTGETVWVPPFLPAGPNTFTTFLGLGIIFLAPGLVASVKKIFKPQPIIPLSPGTMLAPLTGSVQTAMGAGQQFYYASSLRSILPGAKDAHSK